MGSVRGGGKAPDLQQHVDRLLLARWAPAAVVINSRMDVLLFRGRTGNYLEHAPGDASLNILRMARESLGLDLRAVISKAMKQDAPVRHENAHLRPDGQGPAITLEAVPFQLTPSGEKFCLIFFQEAPAPGAAPGLADAAAGRDDQRSSRRPNGGSWRGCARNWPRTRNRSRRSSRSRKRPMKN